MTDFDRAMNELQLGNYSEGMVILQKLLEDEPEDVDILYNLGQSYEYTNQLAKAAEISKIRLKPQSLFEREETYA